MASHCVLIYSLFRVEFPPLSSEEVEEISVHGRKNTGTGVRSLIIPEPLSLAVFIDPV